MEEARQLLELHAEPSADASDVQHYAAAKIEDVRERIRDLARVEANLAELVKACDDHRPTSECPILHALERVEPSLNTSTA